MNRSGGGRSGATGMVGRGSGNGNRGQANTGQTNTGRAGRGFGGRYSRAYGERGGDRGFVTLNPRRGGSTVDHLGGRSVDHLGGRSVDHLGSSRLYDRRGNRFGRNRFGGYAPFSHRLGRQLYSRRCNFFRPLYSRYSYCRPFRHRYTWYHPYSYGFVGFGGLGGFGGFGWDPWFDRVDYDYDEDVTIYDYSTDVYTTDPGVYSTEGQAFGTYGAPLPASPSDGAYLEQPATSDVYGGDMVPLHTQEAPAQVDPGTTYGDSGAQVPSGVENLPVNPDGTSPTGEALPEDGYAPTLIDLGNAAFNQGEYDQASSYYSAHLVKSPEDAVARLFYGLSQFALGQYDLAAIGFRRALELDAELITNPIDVRSIYQGPTAFNEHVDRLKRYVSNSNDKEAYFLLGYVYFASASPEEAIGMFRSVLEIDATDKLTVQLRDVAVKLVGFSPTQ